MLGSFFEALPAALHSCTQIEGDASKMSHLSQTVTNPMDHLVALTTNFALHSEGIVKNFENFITLIQGTDFFSAG